MDKKAVGSRPNSSRGATTALQALILGPLSLTALALQDWYVDVNAPGCATGTGTQVDPFCNIQAAVNAASDGETIHIAPGTYYENVLVDKDLTLTGTGGQAVTVLDGMASGSVVRVRNASATLTGLTLTNGTGTAFGPYASNVGGGLLVYSPLALLPAVTLTNCSVTGNTSSSNRGAGIANGVIYDIPAYPYYSEVGGGILTLTNTTVNANSGIGIFSLEPMYLTNSTISGNVDSYPSYGGGIYCAGSEGTLTLTSSSVSDNDGDGIRGATEITAVDSTVSGNGSGGIRWFREVTAAGCIVSGNGFGIAGGGGVSGTVTMTNSTVSGNRGDVFYAGGIACYYLELTDSVVTGNGDSGFNGSTGGISCAKANLTNCTVSDNAARGYGGGIRADLATLVGCTITGNTAHGNGGGISGYQLTITNSTIFGNSAYGAYPIGNGGGVWMAAGNATLTNSTVTGNTAERSGGGIALQSDSYFDVACTLTMTNSTVTANTATLGGDAIDIYAEGTTECSASVRNSVVWNNDLMPVQLTGADASATFNYSIIEGGWSGSGNIDADPLFVDPMNGDYRLMPGSPAIDSGNNLLVPGDIWLDLDGKRRFLDDPLTTDTGHGGRHLPIVDMGAFEFGTDLPNRLRRAINVPVPYAPPRVIR